MKNTKSILTPKKINQPVDDKINVRSLRDLAEKRRKNQPAVDPNKNLSEIRALKRAVGRLQESIDALMSIQGAIVSDFHDMREDLLFAGLKKGMKNSKKLVKEFESKKDPLLEKCGVKKKAVLSGDDLERIKSRIFLK